MSTDIAIKQKNDKKNCKPTKGTFYIVLETGCLKNCLGLVLEIPIPRVFLWGFLGKAYVEKLI